MSNAFFPSVPRDQHMTQNPAAAEASFWAEFEQQLLHIKRLDVVNAAKSSSRQHLRQSEVYSEVEFFCIPVCGRSHAWTVGIRTGGSRPPACSEANACQRSCALVRAMSKISKLVRFDSSERRRPRERLTPEVHGDLKFEVFEVAPSTSVNVVLKPSPSIALLREAAQEPGTCSHSQ
ncbi:hypothetical protein Esti_005765 [Eimeria stiedai]